MFNNVSATPMTTPAVTQESDNAPEPTSLYSSSRNGGKDDRKPCFTPIPPHRRVFTGGGLRDSSDGGSRSSNSSVLVSLCPSMDLMVLGSSTHPATAHTPSPSSLSSKRQQQPPAEVNLVLHRTMNPQKLSSRSIIGAATGAGTTTSTMNDEGAKPHDPPPGAVIGCWREDGRMYAAITPHNGGGGGGSSSSSNRLLLDPVLGESESSSPPSSKLALQLYAVEDMMDDWASAPAAGVVATTSALTATLSPASAAANVCTCEAAEWRWVGTPSPAWRERRRRNNGNPGVSDDQVDREEEEEEEEWVARHIRFPTHFPPSKYHASYAIEGWVGSSDGASPSLSSGTLANLTNRAFGDGYVSSKWRAGHGQAHRHQDHHLYGISHHLDEGESPTVLPSSRPYSVLAVITLTKNAVDDAETQASPTASATKSSRRSRKIRDRTTTEAASSFAPVVSPRSSSSSSGCRYCYHLTTYLHGRYPWVVDLPLLGSPPPHHGDDHYDSGDLERTLQVNTVSEVLLALSHTLSHAVVAMQTGNSSSSSASSAIMLSVARLPLSAKRDAALASCAIAIDHHLRKFERAAEEISSSYASSLQPLHAKLDALYSTFQRYSVLPQTAVTADDASELHMTASAGMSQCLVSYVMGTADPTVVSAIEQYFTSAQFNDQLLTRMDQSLSVALAGVESAAKELVAVSQVIVVQTSELLGLELAFTTDFSSGNCVGDDGATDRLSAARALFASASHLVLDMERVLRSVIETRFVIRDWVRWMRSVATTVKARGTPPTAVLHQQAVQRRAPDDLSERILVRLIAISNGDRTFGSSPKRVQEASGGHKKQSRAELVLGLSLGPILETVPVAAARVSVALVEWQKGPREEARASTSVKTLRLADKRMLSLTTRLGPGGDEADSYGLRLWSDSSHFTDSDSNSGIGYFLPCPQARSCEEWAVVACQDGFNTDGSCVDLYAVPIDHPWGSYGDDEESYTRRAPTADVASSKIAATWMTRLNLVATKASVPGGNVDGEAIKIVDAVFYGDNGKCSLSSMDGGTGKERRQALAVLVETACGYDSPMLELWLVPYDSCSFVPLPIRDGEIETRTGLVGNDDEGAPSDAPLVQVVKPLPKDPESDSIESGNNANRPVVYARTRSIAPTNSYSSARLVVSGSRGVGAVVTSHPSTGTAVIDLYDLEEDEEEEEDEAEEGIDEDNGSDNGDMSTGS